MAERLRAWVLRFLRVPPEPRVPAGAGAVRVFRAASNFFRYKLALWALGQISALIGLIIGLAGVYFLLREVVDSPTVAFLLRTGEVLAWLAFLVQLPFSFALLRLDFEMRWYILSDRSLRIREGVLSVQEKTMTFANVQQISIRQNPLQRLLSIADVEVGTAGGGSGGKGQENHVGEGMHEAYFRGVDNAEEIRDAIRERVRLHRDAGLGDPDEPTPNAGEDSRSPVLQAAGELREEMRALRRALEPGRGSGA